MRTQEHRYTHKKRSSKRRKIKTLKESNTYTDTNKRKPRDTLKTEQVRLDREKVHCAINARNSR